MDKVIYPAIGTGKSAVANGQVCKRWRVGNVGSDNGVTDSQLGLDCLHSVVDIGVLLSVRRRRQQT